MPDPKTQDHQKPDLLHDLVLGSLITWAGDDADLDDCREIAEHLTPRLREFIDRQPAPFPHGVAWQDDLNVICLCGHVCNADIGRSPAKINGRDTYVRRPAAQVFAQHLIDVRAIPAE